MYKAFITNIGTKSIAGLNNQTINLSRICVSDEKVPESGVFSQTKLVNEVCSLSIVSCGTNDNVFNVTGRIESINVETGFYIKQIGLFLNINGSDVLFQISQTDGNFEGDYIPSKYESPDSFSEYSLSVAMTNSNDINCVVDVTRYAKLEDMEEVKSEIDDLNKRLENGIPVIVDEQEVNDFINELTGGNK